MKSTGEESSRLAESLEASVGNAERGLGTELFLLISRLMPVVNVDLLVKDGQNRTLLTWRDDEVYGAGWHIPGGVIRFRETAVHRVREVARIELGTEVTFDPEPIYISEVINSECDARGHSVSLLYRCTLAGAPADSLEYRGGRPVAGQWKWHARCPPDLIPAQRDYERFL